MENVEIEKQLNFVATRFSVVVGLAFLAAVLPIIASMLGISGWLFPIIVIAYLILIKGGYTKPLPTLTVKWSTIFLGFLVFLSSFFAILAAAASAENDKSSQLVATSGALSKTSSVQDKSDKILKPAEVRTTPNKNGSVQAPPNVTTSPTRPVESVITTVDEVLDTYAENQIAGIRKFGDSKVEIAGTAVRVREAFGTGILVLRSPRNPKKVIELTFSESAEPELAKVRAGRPTKATCFQTSEAMGEVLMSDCRSVQQ